MSGKKWGRKCMQELEPKYSTRAWHVSELDQPNRRLQALARLLQGSSECVSIALFNDKCLIAANNLTQSSRDNKTTQLIKQVMTYFANYADDEHMIRKNRRLALLQQICSERIKGLCKGTIPIPKETIDTIVSESVENESLLNRPFKGRTYKKNPTTTSLIVGEFKRIYRDFRKLENSIKSQSDTFAKLVYAFKNFEILKLSEQPGIHAEVQLLEKIVGDQATGTELPQEIHFGISKLCCLHCRIMLQTSNQVFSENNIDLTLFFQGQHDIDFRWSPPALFRQGYDDGNGTIQT